MSPQVLVVDASVAIKWIVEEDDSGLAKALRGQDLLAPDLLRLECLSAIWRRILRGQIAPAEVPEALILLEGLPIRF